MGGTEGIGGKEDKLGSPWTSRLNNSAPRCPPQNRGPLGVLFLCLWEFTTLLHRRGKKNKKNRASLIFPWKEVQGARQVVPSRVEDKGRGWRAGVSGVLRVTSLCQRRHPGG